MNFRESIWELLSDIAALFEKDEDSLKRGGNVFWNILSVCSVCGHPLKCGAAYEKYLRTYDLAEIHLENAELGWAKTKEACLCGEHFEDAEAEAAHLEGAVLSGAHLENAHLFGAHLEGVNLSGAYLTEADFEGANLKHANLRNSHCEKAVMRGTVLEDAVLNYAHLEGAFLKGAYLDVAVYDENDKICRGTSVGKFVWDGIHLAGGGLKADLQGAFLSPEQVRDAIGAGTLKASEMPDCIEIEKVSGNDICRIYVTKGDETKCIDLSAFGSYWQEPGRPKAPLVWRLLRLEGNKALIITEKLIDCHAYHNKWKNVTWADSEIREWLNHCFLEEAFTDEERGRIEIVCNQNPDNEMYHTIGGVPTWDKVFLLSIDEAYTYFRTDLDRRAAPTPYSKDNGSYVSDDNKTSDGAGTGWWWLRSPGYLSNYAAYVGHGGGVLGLGNYVVANAISVRPALWLNL